jgi:hypothetical protein
MTASSDEPESHRPGRRALECFGACQLAPRSEELRTPLATGYLWIVVIWLLLHDSVPDSTEHAQGRIKSLYPLGTFVGDAATLAALSFVAYLLGSMLRLQVPNDFSGVLFMRRDAEEFRTISIPPGVVIGRNWCFGATFCAAAAIPCTNSWKRLYHRD